MNNFPADDLKCLINSEIRRNGNYFPTNVDLDDYVDKLAEKAEFILEEDEQGLAGIIAYYANDSESLKGYISQVVIRFNWRGEGLFKKLMDKTIDNMRFKGMEICVLEVNLKNEVAIHRLDLKN